VSAENPDPETDEISMFDPAFAACPQPVYRETLSRCPVTRAAMLGSPVITRYEDVMWCMRHPEIFSSEMSLELALGTKRPMIPQQIDPPAQTRYRKILDPLFSRKRMSELAPNIRRDANALIDNVIDAGGCEFNKSFAVPLPCNTFLHMMGLPQDDLDLFLRLKDGIIRPHTLVDSVDMDVVAKIRTDTGKEIYAYFADLITKRRAAPTDDMMTFFLTAELDEAPLTDEEIQDICFLFLLAGLDTVTATIGCNMAYLAANPAQRQLLVDQPSKVEGAVEELLRWETPVTGVPRVAKQDVTIGDFEIKQGELVTLLLGASNVDDEEFGNGNEVDLERERNRHLAFGAGAHRCLGSHLARMELVIALEEWHRRIPDYGIEPGKTPTYSPGIREVQYLPLVWPAR
jgi:cytochrome P450